MQDRLPGSALTATSIVTRALVTGASGGLGAAIARRLAARGVEVWLAARRQAALDAEVDRIRAAGGKAHALVIDLARSDEVHDRLAALDDEVGGIDLVVANGAIAGLPAAVPISRASWSEVRGILDVNLTGNVATLMPFIPRMLARGRGQLVGISSLLADAPNPRAVPYGASKSGLSYFLRAADMELRPRGVACTVVQPGFMRTPAAENVKDPMPFILSADRSAEIIDRAIQRRRRVLHFPWTARFVMRLPGFLPAALQDRVARWMSRER